MLNRFLFLLEDLSPVLGADTAAEVVTSAGETAAAPAAEGGMFGSVWMLVIWGVVIVGMYFLLMRPQRKRENKMKEMQEGIKTGDDVITAGGFFGRIADVGEDCFIVEFGTNRGIRIPVQKSDVLGIRTPKTTPAPKETVE
jgi:preprotein translocase subunit YajC